MRKSVDSHCDQRVAELAGKRWGVLAIEELRACGLTDRTVLTRVRRGQLHRLYPRVYSVGHANPPWEAWMLAAVKAAGPDSWLSHVPGAMLVGILEAGIEVTPEVTVLGGSTRVIRGVRVHRTGALAPEDRWTWRGIPVLSPARLLLNLAGRLTGRPLRSAVRRAQGKNLVTVQQIVALLSRVGPLKGSRRLAQVVATGPAPTRSALEDVVLDLLLDAASSTPT
jgi:hypothetical protein